MQDKDGNRHVAEVTGQQSHGAMGQLLPVIYGELRTLEYSTDPTDSGRFPLGRAPSQAHWVA